MIVSLTKAGVFVFSSLLHLECLQQCLARHRRSVNICWVGEWSQDIFTIWHYVWIRNQHSNIPPCCRGLCWISLSLLGSRSAPCLCGSSIVGMIWGPAHLTSSGCILRQCNMRFLSGALIRESITRVQLIPIPFSSVVLSCNSKPEVDFGTSSFLSSHNICSRLMKKWMIINIITLKAWGYFWYTWKEDGFERKAIEGWGLQVFFSVGAHGYQK